MVTATAIMMRATLLAVVATGLCTTTADAQDAQCDVCGTASGQGKAALKTLTFEWTFNTGADNTGSVQFSTADGSLGITPSSVLAQASTVTVTVPASDSNTRARRKSGKIGFGGTKFGANTAFVVDGESVTLHTSCSQPFFLGTTVVQFAAGKLTLVGFGSVDSDGAARSDADCGPQVSTTPTTTTPCTAGAEAVKATKALCNACPEGGSNDITMLRFQINAGAVALDNSQMSASTVSGTPMPTAPEIEPAAGATSNCGLMGDLPTIVGRGVKPPTALPYTGLNFDSLGDLTQCEPYAASLVCSDVNTGQEYETISLTYSGISELGENRVNNVDQNGLISTVDFSGHESTSPLIRDGGVVIIHNNGGSIGGSLTCTVRSPTRICFGYDLAQNPYKFTMGLPGCADDIDYANSNLFPDTNGCMCQDGAAGLMSSTSPNQVFSQTITLDASCGAGEALTIGDKFGMFELVGFKDSSGRTDVQCGTCLDDPRANEICVGPRFDGNFKSMQTICDNESPNELSIQTECTDSTECPTPAPNLPENCDICTGDGQGKASLTSLSFVWTANTPGAATTITANGQDVLPSATVADGGSFTIGTGSVAGTGLRRSRRAKGGKNTGTGKVAKASSKSGSSKGSRNPKGSKKGRAGGGGIGTNTLITVGGDSATLHTSCSKPIFVGLTVAFPSGTIQLVDFVADGQNVSSCTSAPAPAPAPAPRRRRAGIEGKCTCGPNNPSFALDNNQFKYCSHFWHTCAVTQWYKEYPELQSSVGISIEEAFTALGVNVNQVDCNISVSDNIGGFTSILEKECYNDFAFNKHAAIHSDAFKSGRLLVGNSAAVHLVTRVPHRVRLRTCGSKATVGCLWLHTHSGLCMV